jgi:hypothetical protein
MAFLATSRIDGGAVGIAARRCAAIAGKAGPVVPPAAAPHPLAFVSRGHCGDAVATPELFFPPSGCRLQQRGHLRETHA